MGGASTRRGLKEKGEREGTKRELGSEVGGEGEGKGESETQGWLWSVPPEGEAEINERSQPSREESFPCGFGFEGTGEIEPKEAQAFLSFHRSLGNPSAAPLL